MEETAIPLWGKSTVANIVVSSLADACVSAAHKDACNPHKPIFEIQHHRASLSKSTYGSSASSMIRSRPVDSKIHDKRFHSDKDED